MRIEIGVTVDAGNGKGAFVGTPGDDIASGGNGSDTLMGGAGNDTLNGGNGVDVLRGGAGDDTLTGGNGKDTFILEEANNGTDTITDLEPGKDTIGLSSGLTFAQLTLVAVPGGVAIRKGGETLAVLNGVKAGQLKATDFVAI